MKKRSENGVGEPGQFRSAANIGFSPTDHTPTVSPELQKDSEKKKNRKRKKLSGD